MAKSFTFEEARASVGADNALSFEEALSSVTKTDQDRPRTFTFEESLSPQGPVKKPRTFTFEEARESLAATPAHMPPPVTPQERSARAAELQKKLVSTRQPQNYVRAETAGLRARQLALQREGLPGAVVQSMMAGPQAQVGQIAQQQYEADVAQKTLSPVESAMASGQQAFLRGAAAPVSLLEYGVKRATGHDLGFGESLNRGLQNLYPTRPDTAESFLGGTLPSAFGSAASFLVGGQIAGAGKAATRLGQMGRMAAPASAIGAGSAAQELQQIETDASSIKQDAYVAISGLLGATEALPFGEMLNRMGGAVGGRIAHKVLGVLGKTSSELTENPTVIKRMISGAVEQGIEEMAQEVGAGAAQEFFAGQLGIRPADYKSLWEQGGAGAIVGAVLGGASGLGQRPTAKPLPQATDDAKVGSQESTREGQATQPVSAQETAEERQAQNVQPQPPVRPAAEAEVDPQADTQDDRTPGGGVGGTSEGPAAEAQVPPVSVHGGVLEKFAKAQRRALGREDVEVTAVAEQDYDIRQKNVAQDAKRLGVNLVIVNPVVAGDQLSPLSGFYDPSTRTLAVEAGKETESLFSHELVHDISANESPELVADLHKTMRELDPDGWTRARDEYLAGMEVDSPQQAEALRQNPARLEEEGTATHVQILTQMVMDGSLNHERAVQLANLKPAMWDRIKDALYRVVRKFGFPEIKGGTAAEKIRRTAAENQKLLNSPEMKALRAWVNTVNEVERLRAERAATEAQPTPPESPVAPAEPQTPTAAPQTPQAAPGPATVPQTPTESERADVPRQPQPLTPTQEAPRAVPQPQAAVEGQAPAKEGAQQARQQVETQAVEPLEQAPVKPAPKVQPATADAPIAATPKKTTGIDAATQSSTPPQAVGITAMPVSDIAVDPKRFQFKLDTGAEGVGKALKSARQFDPQLAGVISVWTDPENGQTYVVNGHHRLALAKRSGSPTVNVQHIDAATAKEARSIGAIQNIAEGRGTSVDAAKFFRDRNMDTQAVQQANVDISDTKAREGLAMSNLSDDLFDKVVQGEMTVKRGVAIGEGLPNHADQKALADALAKRKGTVSDDTVAEMIRLAKEAPRTTETETETSLFGEDTKEVNLFVTKAELSSWVKGNLSRIRKVFATVSDEAKARIIEEAQIGQIETGKAAEKKQDAAVAEFYYNQLSGSKGPISDALNDAARRVAGGEDKSHVRRELFVRVRQAIAEGAGRVQPPGAGGRAGVPGGQQAVPEETSQREGGEGSIFARRRSDVKSGQLTLAGEIEGRATTGDTGALFGEEPTRRPQRQAAPTEADLPPDAAKFDLTRQDIHSASGFSKDTPSAAFAYGVKRYKQGHKGIAKVEGITLDEAREAMRGFNKAKAGVSKIEKEVMTEAEERAKASRKSEAGMLFARRREQLKDVAKAIELGQKYAGKRVHPDTMTVKDFIEKAWGGLHTQIQLEAKRFEIARLLGIQVEEYRDPKKINRQIRVIGGERDALNATLGGIKAMAKSNTTDLSPSPQTMQPTRPESQREDVGEQGMLFARRHADQAGVPDKTSDKIKELARREWLEKGTKSRFFRKWFGDSKVVDDQGEPLVVYHGSGASDIRVFDPSKAGEVQTSDWGKGIYFTPSKGQADGYREEAAVRSDKEDSRLWGEYEEAAKRLGTTPMMAGIDLGHGSDAYNSLSEYEKRWRDNRNAVRKRSDIGQVYGAYLRLENPLDYTYEGMTDPFLAERAKSRGHDGVIIRRDDGSIDEIVAFHPEQIKSATANQGTFDPAEADMRFARRRADQAGVPDNTSDTIKDAARKEWLAKGTESRFFRKWFGKSAVVDDQDKPLVVYHGTGSDFTAPTMGFTGAMYFSQDPAYASGFAAMRDAYKIGKASVMPAYLRITKPFDLRQYGTHNIDAHFFGIILHNKNISSWGAGGSTTMLEPVWRWLQNSPTIIKAIQEAGYDGVIMHERAYLPTTPAQTEAREQEAIETTSYLVFSPEQVKSATANRGTFDPTEADMRFARRLPPNLTTDTDTDAHYNESTQGKELVTNGHFPQPDPVTGHRTAIGRIPGLTTPLGRDGLPANGADYPKAVRERDRQTHQTAQDAGQRIAALQPDWTDERIASELQAHLSDHTQRIDDAQLRKLIETLRERIPQVSEESVTRLQILGKGQEADVYLSSDGDAVYKIVDMPDGVSRHAVVPASITKDDMGDYDLGPKRKDTLMDMLERIDLGNRHGGVVYTEVAGITPSGSLILKQPYVPMSKGLAWPEAETALRQLNLKPISVNRMAASDVDGQPVLFVDLHEGNVIQDEKGNTYVVDAAARPLTQQEAQDMGVEAGKPDSRFARRRTPAGQTVTTERDLAPTFYSALAATVRKFPNQDARMTPAQFKGWLAKQPVKAEEIKWTGLDEFLAGKEKVTAKEIAEHLKQNEVRVEEVVHSDDDGAVTVQFTGGREEEFGSLSAARDAIKGEHEWIDNEAFSLNVEDDAVVVLDHDNQEIFRAEPRDGHDGEIWRNVLWEDSHYSPEYDSKDEAIEAAEKTIEDGKEQWRSEVSDIENLDVKSDTKFGQYVLPGGTAYRELLLTLPTTKERQLPPGYTTRQIADGPQSGLWEVLNRSGQRTGFAAKSEQEAINDVMGSESIGAPATDVFRTSHWSEPNVLAHVRFDERTTADGKRTMHIAEVQSDWAAQAREKGIIHKPTSAEDARYYDLARKGSQGRSQAEDSEFAELVDARNNTGRVPDAPFIRSTEAYTTLALRRMIRYAAENGFDSISWDTGEINAERYDLSKQVRKVEYDPTRKGLVAYSADSGEIVIEETGVEASDLASYVGKDVARSLVEQIDPWQSKYGNAQDEETYLRGTENLPSVEGDDLKVGGEGMRAFYDQILPSVANKIGKKWGAKVGTANLPEPTDIHADSGRPWIDNPDAPGEQILGEPVPAGGHAVHQLPITVPMRESVLYEGQPMFARRRPGSGLSPSSPGFSRSSTGSPAPTLFNMGFDVPTENQTQAVVRVIQDSLKPIRDVQAELQTRGGRVDETSDVYLKEELRRGKTKRRIELIGERYVNPILKIAKAAKLTQSDIDLYLYARHAEERNKAISELRGEKGAWSGMETAEARKILKDIESSDNAEAYHRVARLVDLMLKEVRQSWVKDGLMSQEAVDRMEAMYKHYVPLKSDLEDEGGWRGTGRGVDTRGKETKRALGRRSKADSPLAFSITQAHTAIIRAEKNRVGQAFLKLVRDNPDNKLWKINVPERKLTVDKNGMVRYAYDPSYKLADNVVSVKENGKEVHITVDKAYQPIASALKKLGTQDGGRLVSFLGGITRTLAALSTRWNPAFTLFNLIRDIGTGVITTSGEKGLKHGAIVLKDVTKAYQAMFRSAYSKKKGAGKWDQYYRDYVDDGAPIAFMDLKNVSDTVQSLDKSLGQLNSSRSAQAAAALRWLGDAIGQINDIVENATRFAAYVRMREMGESRPRSASYAKNLTTNFERKGDIGQTLNALYMFSNAGIQGTARVGKALKHPGVQKIVASAVVGSAMLDILNHLIAGDDDDGVNYWDKIEPHRKRNYLILMNPSGSGEPLVNIPLPFVYNWFFGLGQNIGAFVRGGKTSGQIIGDVTLGALDAFNPLGGAAHISDIVTPTLGDPFVQAMRNKDWAGRAIMPEFPFSDKPDSEKYFPSVNPTIKSVTSWLNRVTGGDEVVPGWVDISPEIVEHFTSFLTGGAGATAGRVVGMADKLMRGEPVEKHNVPIVRRLFSGQNPYVNHDKFKENLKLIEQRRDQINNAVAKGDMAKAQKLANVYGDQMDQLPWLREVDRWVKHMSGLARNEKDHARKKEIEAQVLAYLKSANGVLNDMRKHPQTDLADRSIRPYLKESATRPKRVPRQPFLPQRTQAEQAPKPARRPLSMPGATP